MRAFNMQAADAVLAEGCERGLGRFAQYIWMVGDHGGQQRGCAKLTMRFCNCPHGFCGGGCVEQNAATAIDL